MDAPHTHFHNITEYLAWDHDGQEDELFETRDAIDRSDLITALARFETYQRKLIRHMRLEETILFPLIESLAPAISTAVTEMRHEHGHVRQALLAMRRALLAGALDTFRQASEDLELVLLAHEAREERFVYPVLDRCLSPEQRADVAARLAREP